MTASEQTISRKAFMTAFNILAAREDFVRSIWQDKEFLKQIGDVFIASGGTASVKDLHAALAQSIFGGNPGKDEQGGYRLRDYRPLRHRFVDALEHELPALADYMDEKRADAKARNDRQEFRYGPPVSRPA